MGASLIKVSPNVWWKAIGGLTGLALLLFGTAGTLRWPQAGLYLITQSFFTIASILWLGKHNPTLLEERMAIRKKFAKSWDRLILLFIVTLSLPYYALPGLDAVRFGWSYLPPWVNGFGYVGVVTGLAVIFLAMRANTFLFPIVKVHREGGHHVIMSGPYGFIRHPMYVGFITYTLSLPVLLGSLWALVPSALVVALLFVRTHLEDKMLHTELDGYADYAKRVRYRIVPGIW